MLKSTCAGRLGRDAETRTTSSGTTVVSFAVAVDRRKGQEKTTTWVDCAMFGDRASKVAPYLTKGTVVAVSGDIELQEFTKRDGGHGAKLSIRVDDVSLLGGGNRDGQAAPQPTQAPAGRYDQSPTGGYGAPSGRAPAHIDDDSIPF